MKYCLKERCSLALLVSSDFEMLASLFNKNRSVNRHTQKNKINIIITLMPRLELLNRIQYLKIQLVIGFYIMQKSGKTNHLDGMLCHVLAALALQPQHDLLGGLSLNSDKTVLRVENFQRNKLQHIYLAR
jgi:hypothetical protein